MNHQSLKKDIFEHSKGEFTEQQIRSFIYSNNALAYFFKRKDIDTYLNSLKKEKRGIVFHFRNTLFNDHRPHGKSRGKPKKDTKYSHSIDLPHQQLKRINGSTFLPLIIDSLIFSAFIIKWKKLSPEDFFRQVDKNLKISKQILFDRSPKVMPYGTPKILLEPIARHFEFSNHGGAWKKKIGKTGSEIAFFLHPYFSNYELGMLLIFNPVFTTLLLYPQKVAHLPAIEIEVQELFQMATSKMRRPKSELNNEKIAYIGSRYLFLKHIKIDFDSTFPSAIITFFKTEVLESFLQTIEVQYLQHLSRSKKLHLIERTFYCYRKLSARALLREILFLITAESFRYSKIEDSLYDHQDVIQHVAVEIIFSSFRSALHSGLPSKNQLQLIPNRSSKSERKIHLNNIEIHSLITEFEFAKTSILFNSMHASPLPVFDLSNAIIAIIHKNIHTLEELEKYKKSIQIKIESYIKNANNSLLTYEKLFK